ncbi:hypothetical protein KR009_010496, partial [Drosophila setifemur]
APGNPERSSEFVVDKIIGKRYVLGRPQALVKWVGFANEESTWEPYENLSTCIVLLCDFEAEVFKRSTAQAKRNSRKRSTTSTPSEKSNKCVKANVFYPHMEHQQEFGRPAFPKSNIRNASKIPVPKRLFATNEISYNRGLADQRSLTAPIPFENTLGALNLSESSDDDPDTGTSMLRDMGPPMSSVPLKPLSPIPSTPVPFLHRYPTEVTEVTQNGNEDPDKEKSPSSCSTSSSSNSNGSSSEVAELMNTAQPNRFERGSRRRKDAVSQLEDSKARDSSVVRSESLKLEAESPSTSSTRSGRINNLRTGKAHVPWKMPPRKTPFGVDRGLELDKVCHSFKVREQLFLFVKWKGCTAMDAVRLEEIKDAYPMPIIKYFEGMKLRYNIPP